MSSARGAAGAVKPKLLNVNTVYAGKNHYAAKAPGVGKHGGLQSLGKTTAVVRRMPPPATLPSLRAESQGQDPNISLVPQGGSGWHTDSTGAHGQATETILGSKAGVGGVGQGSGMAANAASGGHANDLRPTWAKQSAPADAAHQLAMHPSGASNAALSRDFPSLAAATAGKLQTNTLTDSLKPQKSGSWRSGGSSAMSKNEGGEVAPAPQPHPVGTTYPTVSAAPRNVERQLPSRYYDGSAAPRPPPTGAFQIPKQTPAAASSPPAAPPLMQPIDKTESRSQIQESTQSNRPVSPAVLQPAAVSVATAGFPANVAVPPPNYSMPPPNFHSVQSDQTLPPHTAFAPLAAMKVQKDVSRDEENDALLVLSKGGHAEGGYSERPQIPIVDGNVFSSGGGAQLGGPAVRSNDVRASGFVRSDSFDSRNMGFDESSLRVAESDWQGGQFGFPDRDSDSRRWRLSGAGQDSQRAVGPLDGGQSSYFRGRDDEMGRRENVEREAAIERSRQKRRIASQSSGVQDNDGTHVLGSSCGSARSLGYGAESLSEWDRPQSHESVGAHREVGPPVGAHWGPREDGDHELGRKLRRDDAEMAMKAPEFRVLRRPDSRDFMDLPSQITQMSVHDEPSFDEEDGLQMMKGMQAPGKVSKRLSPRDSSPHSDSSMTLQAAAVAAVLSNRATANASPAGHQQRGPSHQNRNADKRTGGQGQPNKRFDGSSGEMLRQNSNQQSRGGGGGRSARGGHEPSTAAGAVPGVATSLVVAPPPPNNVWEKRAEERESAERERAAQRGTTIQQNRLHQHFPPVGDHLGMASYLDDLKECSDEPLPGANVKESMRSTAGGPGKQRGNRYRNNQMWNDGNFSNNGGNGRGANDSSDYYGQEEEDNSGGLFRGQREFVNSRVSAQQRSMRGMSLGMRGARGFGGWRSGGYGGQRRGTSTPLHMGSAHPHRHFGADRTDQRAAAKINGHPLEEEDNFANMGEFHVEDTYETIGNSGGGSEGAPTATDGAPPAPIGADANTERRPQRTVRQQGTQQQQRPTQPLYQTRQYSDEYGQGNARGRRLRGNGPRRGGEIRGGGQQAAERGKRKKEMNVQEEAIGRGICEDDVGGGPRAAVPPRSDHSRRGGGGLRGSQQHTRRRPNSQSQRGSGSLVVGSALERSSSQVKSPVTSEGHDEWETASESSDVAERHTGVHYRVIASTKFNGARRMQRQNNGQRRDNNAGGVSTRAGNGSKNAKPASTTSHAAARGIPPLKEEIAQAQNSSTVAQGSEQSSKQREGSACNRDGLAGLDINDAGVIVIDDRPDAEHSAAEDGAESGDFEEVLSKKSRRLRQQQINEQLEAEERRKQREKEKQERRKAKLQCKKVEKQRGGTAAAAAAVAAATATTGAGGEPRATPQNGDTTAPATAAKVSATCTSAAPPVSKVDSRGAATVSAAGPNILNTTVWNSSIVNEQVARRSPPPLENRPVIPSPIARPTPKTSGASSTGAVHPSTVKKGGVELWTGPDDEQRLTTSKKSPKCGAPNAAAAEVPQQENGSFKNVAVDANDDERLKERLDKVKDFWPGGQQFSNSLLSTNTSTGAISTLDKSPSNAASSLAHGPNVAKVRPQPQTSESSCAAPPLKETASSAASAPMIPPPSPVACIPPGAYLQSLSQVPPPAALPHYSMIFGEPYNPHSTTSPPAQTLFGAGVPVSHAPPSRSRPASFLEQSQLFIHPPPSGSAASSLTWSNGGNPQLDLLTGISATPPLPPTQGANPLQRFQYSTQPRSALSGSSFASGGPLLSTSGKLAHLAAHQLPPPLHPPHSFMGPPPPDLISLQSTALGAVGSQRPADVSTSSAASSNGISRSAVGVLSHMPPPHIQQQLNFPAQSPTGFTLTAAGSFAQTPAIHPFTAPPPPLRYPPVAPLGTDVTGVVSAPWTSKPTVNPLSMKYTNGTAQMGAPIGRTVAGGRQSGDRWGNNPAGTTHSANTLVFQSHIIGKEAADGSPSEMERFPSSQGCPSVPHSGTAEESVRASSVSSVSASAAADPVDGTSQQKKVAKV